METVIKSQGDGLCEESVGKAATHRAGAREAERPISLSTATALPCSKERHPCPHGSWNGSGAPILVEPARLNCYGLVQRRQAFRGRLTLVRTPSPYC